jgi:hypothetical protein
MTEKEIKEEIEFLKLDLASRETIAKDYSCQFLEEKQNLYGECENVKKRIRELKSKLNN